LRCLAQLEHIIAFISRHADGILKDRVHELQNKLIKLRSSPLPRRIRVRFT